MEALVAHGLHSLLVLRAVGDQDEVVAELLAELLPDLSVTNEGKVKVTGTWSVTTSPCSPVEMSFEFGWPSFCLFIFFPAFLFLCRHF